MLPIDAAPALAESAQALVLIPGTAWTAKVLGLALAVAIVALVAQ